MPLEVRIQVYSQALVIVSRDQWTIAAEYKPSFISCYWWSRLHQAL